MCIRVIPTAFGNRLTLSQTYDSILTLDLEISLVWFSRWNYTKILYLLVKYIPFAAAALAIYGKHRHPSSAVPSVEHGPWKWRGSNIDTLVPSASCSTSGNIFKASACEDNFEVAGALELNFVQGCILWA